jgi:hypothetical protein
MTRIAPDDPTHPPDAYERDFALWIAHQAELLRARRFEQLDLDNLIEEIETVGRSERHELRSRLEQLLLHLLKCQFQPARKSGSWLGTLYEQRTRIAAIVKDSPSLRRVIVQFANEAYPHAVRLAGYETGLSPSTFPAANPFSRDQLLDVDFVP